MNKNYQKNTFREIGTIAAFLVMFGLMIIFVPPVDADTPTVTITEYKVTPSVLMPGSMGTVTVTIKNTAASASLSERTGALTNEMSGTTKVTDINVYIENVHLEGNGIDVLSDDFERVGDLGPGQLTTITFSIRAPSKSGMYFPEVWIDTYGGRSTRYPVPVNVNTASGIQKQAILIMDSSLAGSVNPGDEIPVTLTMRNAGQLLADDVTLKITNVSSSVAPKSTDLYHLGTISPGEQKTVTLVLLSDKDAGTGLVRVPVTVSYNALDGTPVAQQTGIDIMMKGRAELGFVSVDTSPPRLTENTPFDLTIRIENTGTGEAKQVSATIDLPAEGTKEAFIGKIKPGNDAPAIFLLEGLKGGNYPYTLTITYTDDMGVHTLTRQMNMRVPPADNSGTIIFALVILVILGAVGYRYWYLPRTNGDGKFPWERKS
ncbi:MAG: S-layer protein [Methanoregula sp.]|nr:S-layer protein [Methanoregula sp.]